MGNSASKTNFLAAVIAILLVIWGVLEFGIHTLKPDAIEREYRITSRFNSTNEILWDRHANLQVSALQASQILERLPSGADPSQEFNSVFNASNPNDILAIIRNDELFFWSDGFTESLYNAITSGRSAIYTDDNGFYLLAGTRRTLDNDHWQITRIRKMFGIANPGTRFGDVYTTVDPALQSLNPPPFYLVGSPDRLPNDYRFNLMSFFDEETVGYFVLTSTDPYIRSYIHPDLDLAVRSIFFALVMLVLWNLLNVSNSVRTATLSGLARIALIWSGIFIGWQIGIFQYIAQLVSDESSYNNLYLRGGLLQTIVLAAGFSLSAYIFTINLYRQQRYYGFTWYPRTITVSLLLGIVIGSCFALYGGVLRFISRLEPVTFAELTLIPNLPTTWVFLVAGVLGLALITFVSTLSWFVIKSEQDQLNWVHPLVLSTGLFSYYIVSESHPGSILGFLFEFTWLGLAAFCSYYAGWILFRNPHLMRRYSAPRLVFAGAFTIALLTFPSFYFGLQDQYEATMERLAKEALVFENWQGFHDYHVQSPYLIAVYQSGQLLRVTGDFTSGQFPDSDRVSMRSRQLFSAGQSSYGIETGPHFRYRELAYMGSNGNIAIVQTRLLNFNNYVYSFFRYYLFLIAAGIIIAAFFSLGGLKINAGQFQGRYQNKIQDAYILSSFILLVLLVVSTQIIIKNQMKNNIELELVENLDLLQHSIQPGQELLPRERLLTSFDYTFYQLTDLPTALRNESGPSIAGPEILPYRVFHALVGQGERRFLDWIPTGSGDMMLVGYRAVNNPGGTLAGVLAIPTVPSANKYTDQVLQTVSVLIFLYLVVFGVFIIGGVFISIEILRPIREFREGLQRVSSGDINSIIPVKSQDEIGELATAYNHMVFKLKDLQDELAESERQTAWTEMARQVAHEIKNPLTPMKLSIQHLYQQVEYHDRTLEEIKPLVRKISNTLVHEIESLSNIASDFSKFARPIVEEFSELDLNDLITDTAELYMHDERVELVLDPWHEPVKVHGASDELKRVLINLIKNAGEAAGTSGLIMVRTYIHHELACLEVVDNGKGMPLDVQKRVFIPNFSTKNTGTGLGLAICKKVVDAHKGRIRFASVVGLGTTFTITVPLFDPKSIISTPAQTEVSEKTPADIQHSGEN